MKKLLAAFVFTTACLGGADSVLGSGPLTPPGPPAPTMKTLDEIEPRTPISSLPFTISQQGSYYLAGNLSGVVGAHGIIISANNVSVDLRGFALVGVSGSLDGIAVTGSRTNIAIRNGAIHEWGNHGVDASSAYNSHFFDLRISGNAGNGLSAGGAALVKNCSARANGLDGISVGAGCTISECMASANNRDGIAAGLSSTVRGCTAFDNTFNGIKANLGSTVVHCTAYSNTNGINVASGSTVLGCSARINGTNGIIMAQDCTVSDCTLDENATGINVGSNCRIANNVCSQDRFHGILVNGTDNRIDGNSLTDNAVGLRSNPATGNLIIRNSAAGNTQHYDVAPGNKAAEVITPGDGFVATNPWANIGF